MNNWNKVFKPIVVLVVICIVVTGALAATNQVTAPIIAEATRVAQEKARKELLPDADAFESMKDIQAEGVSDVSVAKNGAGVVVTANSKGYGGNVTVMVAFNPDDTIKQIKVTEHAETKGIGTRAVENAADNVDFWGQFEGKAAQNLTLGVDIDKANGATISSKAVAGAVNAAIDAYNMIP